MTLPKLRLRVEVVHIEKYRLYTFLFLPKNCPIRAKCKVLASFGFYYSGKKDQVICFSCNFCVDSWFINHYVTSSRWHDDECEMLDCSHWMNNVPLGKF